MTEDGTIAERIDDARGRGRRARAEVVGEDRERATESAVASLCALDELARPGRTGRVALSRPIRDELDVTAAADPLRARGWTIWLPVVGAQRTLTFREWRPGDDLVRGAFGIEEPPDDGRPTLVAGDLDAVVAPCVAVDTSGTRVGFGAGYYDRALADVDSRPTVVVAAFDGQVLDGQVLDVNMLDVNVLDGPLPRRAWDVPADVVATDRRTIRLHRR